MMKTKVKVGIRLGRFILYVSSVVSVSLSFARAVVTVIYWSFGYIFDCELNPCVEDG